MVIAAIAFDYRYLGKFINSLEITKKCDVKHILHLHTFKFLPFLWFQSSHKTWIKPEVIREGSRESKLKKKRRDWREGKRVGLSHCVTSYKRYLFLKTTSFQRFFIYQIFYLRCTRGRVPCVTPFRSRSSIMDHFHVTSSFFKIQN